MRITRRKYLATMAGTAAAVLSPAVLAKEVELSLYYPVAVGGPITKIIGGIAVDDLRDRSADRDRIIQGELDFLGEDGWAQHRSRRTRHGGQVFPSSDAHSIYPPLSETGSYIACCIDLVSASTSSRRLPLAASKMCRCSGRHETLTGDPTDSATLPGARTASICVPIVQAMIVSAPRYSTPATPAGIPSSPRMTCSGLTPSNSFSRWAPGMLAVQYLASASSVASSARIFIGGVPMNRAAKAVAGRS